MAIRRRRHPLNFIIRFLIPAVSTIAAALLFFLALFCFYSAPPPLLTRDDHLQVHSHKSLNHGVQAAVKENAIDEEAFRVPIGGPSSSRALWDSKLSKFYYGCSNATKKFQTAKNITEPNRYLTIATSGGLNQQRTGITDAVVAARILNATLVVPKLDHKSFWKDSSNFSDIFDVDWFISFLSKDVKIIKELPRIGGKVIVPRHMRVPRKCTARCYQKLVLPVLLKRHVVQLSKFDYRLANKLTKDLQKLRCRVNYHALEFTNLIREMGKKLVQRMRIKSQHFIALHLRFEPDMLAFSGCYYGGGEKEKNALSSIRKRWKTLHVSNPDKVRRHGRCPGRCPLTPEEVGLMLRALGFGSDVHIYVASGDVYGGEETMEPLKALFPNIHSKETLVSKKELLPFYSFSSRMAALDFVVCDASDVFATNNNGNMARILAGRRRYFGHKQTIRPNAKKLNSLFINRANMTWEKFASKVRTCQIGFMGEPNETLPGRGEFHENPSQCICENSEAMEKEDLASKSQIEASHKDEKWNSTSNGMDASTDDNETEWPDTDFGENVYQEIRENDYTVFGKLDEQPELDDLLSD